MKKLLGLFFMLLSFSAFAQKPDWVRTPNGPNTIVDWNLKAKSLILPHGTATTLGGSQDSVGHVYMVLNPGVDTSLYMYVGGGVWKPVSKGSSLSFTNGLTKTGSTVSLGGTTTGLININIPGQSFIIGGTGTSAHPIFNMHDGVQVQMGYDDNTTNFFESQFLLTSAFFGNSAYSGKIAGVTVTSSAITLNDEIGLHGLLYEGTYYSSSPKWLTPKRYVDSLVAAGSSTTNSLTNGYAISGSPFNGSTAQTWKVDTTKVTTQYAVQDTIYKHKATIGYGLLYTSGTNTISADTTGIVSFSRLATNLTGYVKISAPQLTSSSTTGYVWTATDAAGHGSWQAASGGGGGTTTNALTLNNSGSGASSGTTFNGSSAITASYNTFGAPGLTASNTFNINSLGTTIAASNASIFVANTTNATSGLQQYSPLIGWQAQYWNTTASASRSVAAYWGLQSQSGTGYAYLAMYTSVDGATPAYNGVEISLTGSMIVGALTSSSTVTMSAGGIGVTSTDGDVKSNATAATNSLAQWSRRSRQSSFYWTGSASNQAEAIEELQTTTSNTAQYVISGRTGGSGSFNPYFGISVINGNWSLNGTAGTTGQVPSSTGSGMQWITPISLTSLSATTPLSYNNTTGAFTIQQASGSQPGYLASADWTTFNGKQAALSGTGFVKISGTTISYDNSTYLTTTTAASTYSPIAGSSSIVTVGSLTSGSIPYSLLSGTVPTWNQNTTGTAANITATSNSTLTTLSALSLPYSQITGTPSLSGYIPYTGATGNVTLGSNTITAAEHITGALGYSDTNLLGVFQSSVNSYNQVVIQNTNSGSAASADFVVNNNNSTASSYYGDFGMNSSGFTGSGAFNAPNMVYLTATTGDLALGTTTSNAIHFVVNSGTTDAATISATGVFSLPGLTSNGLLKTSGGTGAISVATVGTDYIIPSGIVDLETPSGTINGSNTSFTLANTPVTGSVHLYKNGQLLTPTTDYSISGSTITMVVAPISTPTTDKLLADYRK